MSPLSCSFSLNVSPLLCLVAVLLLCPLPRLKSDCSRKCCPPKHVCLVVILFMFPLAAFLLMLPPCACSRTPLSTAFLLMLPPFFVLWLFSYCCPLVCLAAVLCCPFLCLAAVLLILPTFFSCGCCPLVCLAAVLWCPFLCLTAVLLMLPPPFLSSGCSLNVAPFFVLVVCPPCLAAFLLMLLSLAIW